MYYLRRIGAQLIDGLWITLASIGFFYAGGIESLITQEGSVYSARPAPMYPGGWLVEVSVSVEPEETDWLDRVHMRWTYFPLAGWTLTAIYAICYVGGYQRDGQTLGKRLMRLKVVREDGGKVGLGRLLCRWLAYFASGLPLYLGLAWIFVDKRQQGWHDWVCGTRVVPVESEQEKGEHHA